MYYGAWLEGYEFICDRSILFTKSQEDLKIEPVNINSRSVRTLRKKTSADMELSNYPKKINIYLYSHKKEKSIFITRKHVKPNMVVM